MFSADPTFLQNSPLERLRNLCAGCLVLDWLFTLLYMQAALNIHAGNPKGDCWEAHGYTRPLATTLATIFSAFLAGLGGTIHSKLVCHKATARSLTFVNRFAHGLLAWTLLKVVLEAYANQHEPPACNQETGTENNADENEEINSFTQGQIIWEVLYTMLWLGWVTCAGFAAVFSRRCLHGLQSGAFVEGADRTLEMPGCRGSNDGSSGNRQGTVAGDATGAPGAVSATTAADEASSAEAGASPKPEKEMVRENPAGGLTQIVGVPVAGGSGASSSSVAGACRAPADVSGMTTIAGVVARPAQDADSASCSQVPDGVAVGMPVSEDESKGKRCADMVSE